MKWKRQSASLLVSDSQNEKDSIHEILHFRYNTIKIKRIKKRETERIWSLHKCLKDFCWCFVFCFVWKFCFMLLTTRFQLYPGVSWVMTGTADILTQAHLSIWYPCNAKSQWKKSGSNLGLPLWRRTLLPLRHRSGPVLDFYLLASYAVFNIISVI